MHPYDGSHLRSVALMDHCSIHHVDAVVDLFEAASINVIFHPTLLITILSNDIFDFVRGILIPNRHPYVGSTPRSVALMDNCSIHHVNVDIFKAASIKILSSSLQFRL